MILRYCKGEKQIFIKRALVVMVVLIGILVRVMQLGNIPGGINQDEAFAGYEAYSLVNYGLDTQGYHNPVYLVAWGSGMNALNTYLMIPFIKIFGLNTMAIRLPQVLLACLSLVVFYLLLRKVFDESLATIGLFLLTINPWHIMMARWGLESNLAPAFLLFGLYFFILGLEKEKWLLISALAYGLSLYCYATIWPAVPFLILGGGYYAWRYKKVKISIITVSACIILFVMALPLIYFFMLNTWEGMAEINNRLFSIPKLIKFRGGEFSLKQLVTKIYVFYQTIVKQEDGLIWNSTEEFGLYYKFSIPFACIGLVVILKDILYSARSKEYNIKWFILWQLCIFSILGVLIKVNTNRINCIHMYIIVLIAIGLVCVGKNISKEIRYGFLLLYCISFIGFQTYYFSNYRETIAQSFQRGLEEALSCAKLKKMEKNSPDIYVSDLISYPKILFYSKLPVTDYLDTVQYNNFPSAFLNASRFGYFNYEFDKNDLSDESVYLITRGERDFYLENGFKIIEFDTIAVAY